MITALKVLHSLVFFTLVAALGILTWTAVTGEPTRLTWVALALLMGEVLVVGVCRGECPLTVWTERLGAESGSVVDLFLPKWVADRAFLIGGVTLVLSLLVLALRLATW